MKSNTDQNGADKSHYLVGIFIKLHLHTADTLYWNINFFMQKQLWITIKQILVGVFIVIQAVFNGNTSAWKIKIKIIAWSVTGRSFPSVQQKDLLDLMQ